MTNPKVSCDVFQKGKGSEKFPIFEWHIGLYAFKIHILDHVNMPSYPIIKFFTISSNTAKRLAHTGLNLGLNRLYKNLEFPRIENAYCYCSKMFLKI